MKKTALGALSVALVSVLAGGCQSVDPKEAAFQAAYREEVRKGKALYEERCATVAGEKIYKTVENVEGILLMNVPAMGGERAWFDRNWPGAAFTHQRSGGLNSIVQHFLWYQSRTASGHTSPTTDVTPWPGYRYVDVDSKGAETRTRYQGRWEEPWQYDKSYLKGYIKFFLDKVPSTTPPPRYGVKFDDRVIPEERSVWVASGVVKVIDLSNDEVLGELMRYAIAYSRPVPGASPPWLGSSACGGQGGADVVRNFVEKVLIPVKRGHP